MRTVCHLRETKEVIVSVLETVLERPSKVVAETIGLLLQRDHSSVLYMFVCCMSGDAKRHPADVTSRAELQHSHATLKLPPSQWSKKPQLINAQPTYLTDATALLSGIETDRVTSHGCRTAPHWDPSTQRCCPQRTSNRLGWNYCLDYRNISAVFSNKASHAVCSYREVACPSGNHGGSAPNTNNLDRRRRCI